MMAKFYVFFLSFCVVPQLWATCVVGIASATVAYNTSIRKKKGLDFGYIRKNSAGECISVNDRRRRGEYEIKGMPNSTVFIQSPANGVLKFSKAKSFGQVEIIPISQIVPPPHRHRTDGAPRLQNLSVIPTWRV